MAPRGYGPGLETLESGPPGPGISFAMTLVHSTGYVIYFSMVM
jgi:hypothetical protein